RTRLHHVTLLQLVGRDDVALRAVHVVEQRDAGRAVRVVLDVRDARLHAVLVMATEVDDAVLALVTAALVAGGHTTVAVASAFFREGTEKRLLRRRPGHFDEVGDGAATAARRRRLVLTDSHCLLILVCQPALRARRRRCRCRRP